MLNFAVIIISYCKRRVLPHSKKWFRRKKLKKLSFWLSGVLVFKNTDDISTIPPDLETETAARHWKVSFCTASSAFHLICNYHRPLPMKAQACTSTCTTRSRQTNNTTANYFQHGKQTRPCTAVGWLFELLHVFPLLLHSWIPWAEKGFTESLTTERKLQCLSTTAPWLNTRGWKMFHRKSNQGKETAVCLSIAAPWLNTWGWKRFHRKSNHWKKPCENPSPSAWNQLPLLLRQTLSKLPAKDSSVWQVCFWHTHLHWPHSAAICFSQ